DRKQALQRSHRALTEMRIAGLATVLPFHRRVIQDPNFAPELDQPEQKIPSDGPFTVHTRRIETDFINDFQPQVNQQGMPEAEGQDRRAVRVEVNGKRVEVRLPDPRPALLRLNRNLNVVVLHVVQPAQVVPRLLAFQATPLPPPCRAQSSRSVSK